MKTWMLTSLGAVVGGIGGWAWWHYFGCTSGCAITSSPVNSTLYGALLGALLSYSSKKPGTAAADKNR